MLFMSVTFRRTCHNVELYETKAAFCMFFQKVVRNVDNDRLMETEDKAVNFHQNVVAAWENVFLWSFLNILSIRLKKMNYSPYPLYSRNINTYIYFFLLIQSNFITKVFQGSATC